MFYEDMEIFQRTASSQLIYSATEPWRAYGGVQRKNVQKLKNMMNAHLESSSYAATYRITSDRVNLPQSNDPESKAES